MLPRSRHLSSTITLGTKINWFRHQDKNNSNYNLTYLFSIGYFRLFSLFILVPKIIKAPN